MSKDRKIYEDAISGKYERPHTGAHSWEEKNM